jgi:hypothetical protein
MVVALFYNYHPTSLFFSTCFIHHSVLHVYVSHSSLHTTVAYLIASLIVLPARYVAPLLLVVVGGAG